MLQSMECFSMIKLLALWMAGDQWVSPISTFAKLFTPSPAVFICPS